uniref:Uncharacterized protein n=1 Tax=Xenopus tropicalis TaxID=8364 RepID=A0A6I8QTL8_XENTR
LSQNNSIEKLTPVKHKILVLSGKGSVGKSTFSAHLAPGLTQDEDEEVALLDVDICGPSIPKIMDFMALLHVKTDIRVMSVGFLISSPDDAVIWKGLTSGCPKRNQLLSQSQLPVIIGEVENMSWFICHKFPLDPKTGKSSVRLYTGFYATKTCLQTRNLKIGICFEATGSNIQGVGAQHVAHGPLLGDHWARFTKGC